MFQSLDRVQFYNSNGELIGDTNILDLDQSVFSRSDIIIEESIDGKKSDTIRSSNILEEKRYQYIVKNIILEKYNNEPLTLSKKLKTIFLWALK